MEELNVDRQLDKALAHPMRARILDGLASGKVSCDQLARNLGESVSMISYHLCVLVGAGCVLKTTTLDPDGATEHYELIRSVLSE